MAITYSTATNWITVTGYTEIAPCTFVDVYNADKAGTLSLHARVGIAGIDGAAVAVDRAERPTDYVILGGASGDLYITVANWNLMTNATIRITGTDRDGAAQTDDVVVNANGNFNSAKWFKTITHTQVTVFNTPGGGSFDYDLTQGQWGRVWRIGNAAFLLDARLRVGDGVNTTWFIDTNKLVEFSTLSPVGMIYVEASATFRLGTLVDAGDRSVSGGCAFVSNHAAHSYIFRSIAGDMQLYGCSVYNREPAFRCRIVSSSGNPTVIYHFISSGASLEEAINVEVYDYYTAYQGVKAVVGAFDTIKIDQSPIAIYSLFAQGLDLADSVVQSSTIIDVRGWAITADMDLTNVIADWTVNFGGACTAVVNRQYTFNLRVVDSDGAGIPNVTVTMDDVADTQIFSVNTDANGDIAEQTILYGYYAIATGGVLQPVGSYSPHLVTLRKTGYAPRTIRYIMDRQREEIEKLGGAAPHGMEYRRRRVPGEVSALAEFE